MATKTKVVTKGHGSNNAFEAIFLGTHQTIAITSGGSAMLSAAVGANTKLIRYVATVATYVEIATSPAATASTSAFVPANTVQLFGITGGDKVSIKDAAASGSAFITEALEVT